MIRSFFIFIVAGLFSSACQSIQSNNAWVLDGGSSVYFEVRQDIRTKIVNGWNSHRGAPTTRSQRRRCQSEVQIVLNSEGKIVHFKFVQKSAFKTWNDEIERAVKEAAPFGELPPSILDAKGLADFNFKFYVTDKDL